MESGGTSSSTVVPKSMIEALKRTCNNIDEVQTNLREFLAHCDAETLSEMEPVNRAQALCLMAQASTTLFALRLRCKGINPDEHPVSKELERLRLYQEKLQHSLDLNRAPLRPSATINSPAAARFIDHSLRDLSKEQKQRLRNISQGETHRLKYIESNMSKKRKQHHSLENKPVRVAAQEFLEKAASELLGGSSSGVKGPLGHAESDDGVIILD